MRFLSSACRVGMMILASVAIAACGVVGSDTGETTQEVVSTDLAAYTSGQNIVVTYSNMNGSSTDWIAIAQPNDPPNTYEAWLYTGGGTSGTLTFNMPNLLPGTYEARAFYDWAGTSSFTIQQRSPTFTFTGTTAAMISTDQTSYPANSTVTVSYSNMPGNPTDWVAISVAGSPVTSYVQWTYTNGTAMGTQAFAGLAPGSYEARAYIDDSFALVAKSTFTIAGTVTVTTDQPNYSVGQTVTVIYSNMPGNAADYVAVALAGSPDSSFVAMASTGGAINGSAPFMGLAAGNYEARAYLNGSTTVLARSTFAISSMAATVTTDASSYVTGQTVTVTYSNLPGNATDWIAISPAGSSDFTYTQWVYTGGAINGLAPFNGLAAGTYEARAYLNNTFTVIARSAAFTVTDTSMCTVTTPPQLASLNSGDISISATSQTASAALTVNLATSILFVSMNEAEPDPNYGAVMCALHADDPDLGPAGVTCLRNDVGTNNPQSTGVINIHWTVVTFSTGVAVQRGIASTSTTNPLDVTLTSVDTSKSFVILTGMTNGGGAWGSNEFVRAELTSATDLNLRNSVAGTTVAWQVVTMDGATVQRGGTSFASADTSKQVAVASAPSGSILLTSYTTDNTGSLAAAALMMQSTIASSTSLDFRRNLGGSNLDVSYEVVSLPFATHYGLTTFGVGNTTATVPVSGIVPTSSVAIASNQAVLGESSGSTTYAGALDDLLGETSATLSTMAGGVSVVRASSQANATIPWTVIDFAHNCAGM